MFDLSNIRRTDTHKLHFPDIVKENDTPEVTFCMCLFLTSSEESGAVATFW